VRPGGRRQVRMKIAGYIRIADKTSCGGTVVEGEVTCTR